MFGKIKILGFLFISIFICSINFAQGQMAPMRISGGLSTIQIIGKNVATMPFITDQGDKKVYGGSYDQSQPGLKLELTVPLDMDETFEIPIGVEYNFFRGRERVPFGSDSMGNIKDIKMRHDNDLMTFDVGLNYSFWKFKALEANARVYAGIDTKTTIIFGGKYSQTTNYSVLIDNQNYGFDTKPTTVRFGGIVNLGVNGELVDPFYVDIKAGLGVMNLVGRNDAMGELFTLGRKNISYLETKENYVYTFNISMMLQIRL